MTTGQEKSRNTLVCRVLRLFLLEAEEGIEPSNDGFANHCLTTWLLRRALGAGAIGYVLPLRVSMPGLGEIGRFFKKAGRRVRGFSKRFLLMLDEPGTHELDGHSA